MIQCYIKKSCDFGLYVYIYIYIHIGGRDDYSNMAGISPNVTWGFGLPVATPLRCGTSWDVQVAFNGSLCYFSIKENKRADPRCCGGWWLRQSPKML